MKPNQAFIDYKSSCKDEPLPPINPLTHPTREITTINPQKMLSPIDWAILLRGCLFLFHENKRQSLINPLHKTTFNRPRRTTRWKSDFPHHQLFYFLHRRRKFCPLTSPVFKSSTYALFNTVKALTNNSKSYISFNFRKTSC